MVLGFGLRRQTVHAFADFDDALLALSILPARRWDIDPHLFCVFEERAPR